VTPEQIISTYGYAAVFVGTLLEGETIVVLAGFAARRGYLSLPWVIAAAFAGSFLVDQLLFWLGRRYGRSVLERRPAWHDPAERAFRLLRRYDTLFVLGFRFLYGLRTVSPVAIGIAGVPPRRYLLLNAIAAAAWAAAFSLAGYLFGRTTEVFIGDLARNERELFALLLALGLLVWIGYLVRRRLRARREKRSEKE
jgi:membrane protein DedA with SNARE-associated domain